MTRSLLSASKQYRPEASVAAVVADICMPTKELKTIQNKP